MYNTTTSQSLLRYANKELFWIEQDNQDLYNKNLRYRFADLEHHQWIDRKISYKFNSQGFRCEEFTDDPSVMFVGCSRVFGTGIPLESTWSYIVASQLNLKCINLGVNGASNDTAFRLINDWGSMLKPKIIIFLPTEKHRLEVHTDEGSANIGAWSSDYLKDKLYREWCLTSTNGELNYLKNKLAIEYIASKLGIRCIVINDNMRVRCDLARDLLHAGTLSNELFSKKVH